MIQTNELRIGNLVEKDGEIYVADFITIKMAHNYNPIPLTEDWLLRFGFEKLPLEKNSTYMGNADLNFGYPILKLNKYEYLCCNNADGDSGYLFLNRYRIPCKYVHQLQNLYFALTNTELIIKNH